MPLRSMPGPGTVVSSRPGVVMASTPSSTPHRRYLIMERIRQSEYAKPEWLLQLSPYLHWAKPKKFIGQITGQIQPLMANEPLNLVCTNGVLRLETNVNIYIDHTLLVTETDVEVLTAATENSPGGPIPMSTTTNELAKAYGKWNE